MGLLQIPKYAQRSCTSIHKGAKAMLSNVEIKSIFLECENTNPNGMYADDVDIIEYARAIEIAARIEERRACITLVKSLNHEVARALEDYRRLADKVE
jgi:ethanolamine utilization cobalamin adenosyltransferase